MIVLVTLLANGVVFAQSITEFEAELIKQKEQLNIHNSKLDSLNNIYSKKLEEIDLEKSKNEKDEDKIKQLMSGTISLSYQIDLEREEVEKLQSNLKKIKDKLNALYGHRIDSLKSLEDSGHYSANRDLLNLEILLLMEKKLSDGINTNSLSYDPALLLGLDENSIHNEREKEIYKDYLKNASNEVDDKIKFISGLVGELDEANRLHKKVDKFIEDAEFESNPLNSQSDAYLQERSNIGGGVFDNATLQRNFESYSFLYNQLAIQQFSYERNTDYTLNRNKLSADAFIELLKEINTRLENYNSLLTVKLSELNNADN